jgi:hypothetical protein
MLSLWLAENYFIFLRLLQNERRGSAVGIATAYGLDDKEVGVLVPVWLRIVFSRYRLDWLWDQPNHMSNEYLWLFLGGKAAGGVKLTIHLQLVPRSRKRGPVNPLPHKSSWRSGSLVNYKENFTFTFFTSKPSSLLVRSRASVFPFIVLHGTH